MTTDDHGFKAMEAIEKLYKCFSVLADAKDKISEHSKEYLEILAAVKGESKQKILASQFITRFFKSFPEFAHEAIEALLDLCEDEDVVVRKQAIKDLPYICKDSKHYIQKIADILAQLLQAEDQTELTVVHNSLMTLFKLDAKGCLGGIYGQILSGDDAGREKCLRFLNNKIRTAGREYITKDVEEYLITETKKVLQDVTALEFNILMDLLGGTRLGSTVTGQQELVDLVADMVEINQPFLPGPGEENELLDRLISLVRHALPYFSSKILSTKFVAFIINQVLNQLDKLISDKDPIELELLKILAELTVNCGALENKASTELTTVFNRLLKYLPLPPLDTEELDAEPRLEFSHVECLMFSFHQLLKQNPEFLENAETLKDFRMRLQYFARGIQGYIKKLKEALAGKSEEEMQSDENKLKVSALRTTNNINTLIKDLFHCPPSSKAVITLSWKTSKATAANPEPKVEASNKRHTPITISDRLSGAKKPRELYQPPGGKFSNSISPGHRGGFRGRGRFRGGRRGRSY